MAEIRKRSGKWCATVQIPNTDQQSKKSQSKTFESRLDALIWAERIENGDRPTRISDKTFAHVAKLYRDRVTPMKKGRVNETIIINHLLKAEWVGIRLSELTIGHLEDYRDARLKTIKPSTFRRQWLLIRSIARYASPWTLALTRRCLRK